MSRLELKALVAALIFIIIEGVGMFTMYHVFGISYSSDFVARVLIYTQFILVIYVFVVNINIFKNLGFEKLRLNEIKCFLPFAILGMLLIISSIISADWKSDIDYTLLIQTVIMTLFVGIAEEVMFRGIVLKSFLKKGKVKRAVIISAVAFSLLHSVNILAGVNVITIIPQLVLTLIFGLSFGWIAVKIKNIIPLIIFHWIWDMCVISSKIIGSNIIVLSTLAIILQVIVVIHFMKKVKVDGDSEIV
ncbi:MAG: CPBP family intramembrane metalloprotease [Firmicutes bacterium]|jgi:membrane protease YdiL (CAAX protease family)|nr:CPBP family intramembrane metalloprotease [Bacillota bacterium]